MSKTKQHTLKLGPKAMGELFKPSRLEVYESLQIAGPSSIADLALRLGRPADSLYYHVKKLLKIGVIEELDGGEAGRRTSAADGPGRIGAVYSTVATRLDVELKPKSRLSREAWSAAAAAVLRLGQRDFTRALESGKTRQDGARRNLMLRRIKVRLNAAQAREVNAHIEALNELLGANAENTEGELHAITCVMTPLEDRQQG